MDAIALDTALIAAADQIVEAGRRMDRFGWVPSYGGNLSMRLTEHSVAVTRSGGRKGFLTRENVIQVDLDGQALRVGDKPSAETLLHCQIYEMLPEVGAVLHGHSVPATLLSRLATDGGIRISGYEMIKAFEGQVTHDTTITLPVIPNDQDMYLLRDKLTAIIPTCTCGYVLSGHGVYVWGRTMEQAISNYEGLEFLLSCELEARKLGVSFA